AKRDDDGRQRQRQGEQAQDERAAGKVRMSRQGASDKDRRYDGQRRRQQRLPQGEPGDPDQIGVEGCDGAAEVAQPLDEQASEGAADQQRNAGERDDAREDAAVCHRLIAASHSSTQALRLAATSSAENCSVLDGSTSLPNAGSRGLSV